MSRSSEIGVVAGGLEAIPSPAPGLVRIRAVDNPTLGVVAELDGPVLPAGYAQWSQIERPKKLPITSFSGLDPLVLPIPMLLDRWSVRGSVEPEIRVIETMLGRHGIERPPTVIIEGIGIPFSFERDSSLRFVLTDPSWGDDIRTTGQSGARSFVQMTISAVQIDPAQLVLEEDAKSRSRKFFKVGSKPPYTLKQIAARYRVKKSKLIELNRTAGKMRKGVSADPDKRIKPGVKVRIG